MFVKFTIKIGKDPQITNIKFEIVSLRFGSDNFGSPQIKLCLTFLVKNLNVKITKTTKINFDLVTFQLILISSLLVKILKIKKIVEITFMLYTMNLQKSTTEFLFLFFVIMKYV